MSYSSSRGYYGESYDRHIPMYNDQSTIYKMKETYWTTKQAVMKKLGKKEDEHVVASDSELDAKLEVFKAIQKSSIDLLRVIEKYQDRICVLSREENAMGRLLKSESQHDKTRAGKMMAAVGKAQCFSSQQMLQLRAPLVRLYQEVETFRYRAITDTLITIKRMEAARTEYRGTLLWMKDVSNELDPDTSKQLQKFRTVQAQVKKTKAKFDKLKLDVMQKVDLLAASRCNMFSHVLAKYQSTLLHFWEKTAFRMTAVADSFKGYQYYEFSMLKELGEPSKKLAEETGGIDNLDKDLDDSQDEFSDDDGNGVMKYAKKMRKEGGEEVLEGVSSPVESLKSLGETQENQLVDVNEASKIPTEDLFSLVPISISTSEFYSSNEEQDYSKFLSAPILHDAGIVSERTPDLTPGPKLPEGLPPSATDLTNASIRLKDGELPCVPPIPKAAGALTTSTEDDIFKLDTNSLGSLDSVQPTGQEKNDSMTNLFLDGNKQKSTSDAEAFIDFGDDEDVDLEEIKRKQDEEFDFTGMMKQSAAASKKDKPSSNKDAVDLLGNDLEAVDLSEKEDMEILKEILDAPSSGSDFAQEWNAMVAGNTPLSPNSASNAQTLEMFSLFSSAPSTGARVSSQYMPSSLLELGSGFCGGQNIKPSLLDLASSATPSQPVVGGAVPLTPQNLAPQLAQKQQGPMPKKKPKHELSSWFNLFAELDPLANPDAIGRKNDDITDA